jgi:hypothetical protein
MRTGISWQKEFNREIFRAELARLQGNEGKARVCARRAASAAIAEFLERKGLPDPGVSAIDRLRLVKDLQEVSEEARQAAHYLLVRVAPDHNLPIDVDLIAEARRLEQELLEC